MGERVRLSDSLAYPPRMMRAERAAGYLGMSTSQFLKMVHDQEMPQPIKVHSMSIWDRLDLDAAVDDLKAKQNRSERNMVDVLLGIEDDHH